MSPRYKKEPGQLSAQLKSHICEKIVNILLLRNLRNKDAAAILKRGENEIGYLRNDPNYFGLDTLVKMLDKLEHYVTVNLEIKEKS